MAENAALPVLRRHAVAAEDAARALGVAARVGSSDGGEADAATAPHGAGCAVHALAGDHAAAGAASPQGAHDADWD